MNAIGLGLIGFAVIRPLTEDVWSMSFGALWWLFAGLVFHGLGHYVQGRLIRADVAQADPKETDSRKETLR